MSPVGRDPAALPAAAMRELPDAELVRRVADRRQEALEELYARYSGLLLGLTRRILGNTPEAEEVVQEALLQAWEQAARYDPRRAAVSTWLVLLARSRAIDLLRSRGVRARASEASASEPREEQTSPEGPAAVWQEERRRRVQGALADLPGEQREVLELAFYRGMSQREIAEARNLPLGTVKTRTLLALRKLRAALRGEVRELL